MGVVKKVPVLLQKGSELKELLASGSGFFPVKPYSRPFELWSVYTGLALEDSRRNDSLEIRPDFPQPAHSQACRPAVEKYPMVHRRVATG
jgi:hypothetical protein